MMKRMALSLLAVGVISLVVTAASFALFTATTTNSDNTFSAGTVTLGAVAGCANTINNIAPGDSGNFTCTVTYTGSLDAYVGYSASMTGDLTSCDGGGHFTAGIDTSGAINTIGIYANGGNASVNVPWALALAAGNDCQGDGAVVSITFHAVQERNNNNGADPISWN